MRVISNAYRHKKQSLALILTVIVMSVLIFVSVAVKASNKAELNRLYNSIDVKAFMSLKRGDGYATYEQDSMETDMVKRVLRYSEFIERYSFTKFVTVRCVPVEDRDDIHYSTAVQLLGLTNFQMLEGYYDGAVSFMDGYGFEDFLVSKSYKKIVLLREELADSMGVKPGDTVTVMQAFGIKPSKGDMRFCYDALVVGVHTLGPEAEGAFDIVVPVDFAVPINFSSSWSSMSRYDVAWFDLKNLDRLDEFKDLILSSGILYKYRFVILDDDLRLVQNSLNDTLMFINIAISSEYVLTIIIAFVISFILIKTRLQEIALSRAVGESIAGIFFKLLLEFSFVCAVGVLAGNIVGIIISVIGIANGTISVLDISLSNLLFLLSFAVGSTISLLTTVNIRPIEILTRKE